jgi:O-antigen ligase
VNVFAPSSQPSSSHRSRLSDKKLLGHWREIVLYAAIAGVGFLMGQSVAEDTGFAKQVVALACLGCVFLIPAERVFLGWLFAAPLVQGTSAGSHPAHAFFTAFFLVPPILVVARAAMEGVDLRRLWVIDVLPALYILYIFIRLKLAPSEFTGAESSLRSVYAVVGIGIAAYYFIVFARTSERFPLAVAKVLLWSGIIVAILALVEAFTDWNLWNTKLASGDLVHRVVSTFASPGELGTYLGVGIAFAVAILVFSGPSSLRWPATLLICLAVPALYFTYTRGPILATAVVGVLLPLLANRARWPSLLLFAAVGVLIFASWNQISTSHSYKARLGVTSTVKIRQELQHLSTDLFRQHPVFGWGYNSFDRAKLTQSARHADVERYSSHDTFLRVLVELGVTGLVLLVLPWVVISWRAVAAAHRGRAETWIVAASVGALLVYVISALTYDTRFFYIGAAPFIAAAVARTVLVRRKVRAEGHLAILNPASAR